MVLWSKRGILDVSIKKSYTAVGFDINFPVTLHNSSTEKLILWQFLVVFSRYLSSSAIRVLLGMLSFLYPWLKIADENCFTISILKL